MKTLWMAVPAVFLAGCSSAPPPQKQEEPAKPAIGSIVRQDPAFDALVSKDAQIEKAATGFTFVEGPLWRPDGRLWFSDLVGNKLRAITPDGKDSVLMENAGGSANPPAGSYSGPNGMIADKDGSLLMCQHFNRQIARVDKDMKVTTFINKYEGKRLNSPNDLVYKSDGSLYFTDPPFGLPKMDDDPAKELKFNGVYRYANGKLTVLVKDLPKPNGLAFSPDEKFLYVSNSGPKRQWMRYDVAANGSLSNGKVIFDVSDSKNEGVPDGLKVDTQGNIYATGPEAVRVLSPDGKLLGSINLPENPSNVAWGGDDGKTLYITAVTSVYRVKMSVGGPKALYQ